MRLSTLILRSPFGMSGTVTAANAHLSEIDEWKRLRRKMAEQHFRDVAGALDHLNQNPLGIASGYRHDDSADPVGEWWTVISYDGEPL